LIRNSIASVALLALLLKTAISLTDPAHYFKIRVIDRATRRGVPLVELRATNDSRWITDSNGIVAFDDEGLMGRKVFFSISSHGYTYPKDGFGFSGVALDAKPGGSATIELDRQNIAERLYRITGEGIYRDSLMVGEPVPLRLPQLNGGVMGQDTVEVTPYHGKLYWFWGDTNRSDYPLGNFHTSGATSQEPSGGGLNPSAGIDLTYFTDSSGFCKAMLPNKEPGPVWIGGLCTVLDSQRNERLLCNYARMKGLGDVQERGLALFDDEREVFEPINSLDIKDPQCPLGHPVQVDVLGVSYVYSAISDSDPIPGVRVLRDLKHVTDPGAYEAYTCLAPGSRYNGTKSTVDRNADGTIRYAWKPATAAVTWKQQQELIHAGKLKSDEALIQLRDVDTGKVIQPAGGSVFWNRYLHKWVMIFGQLSGSTSLLGEIWYSAADTPTGLWVYARKIVTHNNYTFYNPAQDPFFNQSGGKEIFFEGTYTRTFSDNKDPTPRYDYNQIMYRLSLDDPRLMLPSPVYAIESKTSVEYCLGGSLAWGTAAGHIQGIPFFAMPAPVGSELLIPLYEVNTSTGLRLVAGATNPQERQSPLAYVVSTRRAQFEASVLEPLYEYRKSNGSWVYSTNPALKTDGIVRSPEPICRVWPNPMTFLPLDWSDHSHSNTHK
jgi:hypothetical protein